MWKWASTKGGATRSPAASISRPANSASFGPMAAIRPSAMAISTPVRPSGKLALRMTRSIVPSSIGYRLQLSGLLFPVSEFGFVAHCFDFRDPVLHGRLRIEDGLIVYRGSDFTQTIIEQQPCLEFTHFLVHIFRAVALDRSQQALLNFLVQFDCHSTDSRLFMRKRQLLQRINLPQEKQHHPFGLA